MSDDLKQQIKQLKKEIRNLKAIECRINENHIVMKAQSDYIQELKNNHALEVAFLKTTIQQLKRDQKQRNNDNRFPYKRD